VSWNAIENATSYKVYSNGSLLTTTAETTLDLSTLITDPGEYIIKIIAVGAPYGDSAYSNEIVYTGPLSAPVLAINEDTLNIYTVPLATSYDIYANSNLLTTVTEDRATTLTTHDTNIWSIDLSTLITDIGTYSISAVAKADGYIDSIMSDPVIYTIDTVVTIETNSAGGETYTIDSTDYTTMTNTANGGTYVINTPPDPHNGGSND
jgi:hypothetical protein